MSFYKALHNLSTADFYDEGAPRKRRVSGATKEFYEIERVISRRVRRGKVGFRLICCVCALYFVLHWFVWVFCFQIEYYVKWKGFSSLENTWEPRQNLNSAAISAFENPTPSTEAIELGKDALACGLLEQLKSRSTLPTVITFRHDVLNYFFNGKGKTSNERGSILLNKEDFRRCCFPDNWDRVVDSIGDGVKIDFPVKLRAFLSWSPRTHHLVKGTVVPSPRYRPEKLSISMCKVSCSLT
ncbi:uncharacterized protein LOC114518939 isoform X1 [Dendronephthya gigantea]|uniref:uncharacterized protein LOC114518939 isoform X1 n=1 Tax=Dendronephthya gigantea TaxID=151771 RepID=UPI00106BCE3A|nr:uncharacterized protein LOC114518939 isoform X1 [Dendronephthya gigantea]